MRLGHLVGEVRSEGLQAHSRRLVDVYEDTLIIQPQDSRQQVGCS